MIQKLQVKTGINLLRENLLIEIHQIMYSLYQGKEIIIKVYCNIMNSMKV